MDYLEYLPLIPLLVFGAIAAIGWYAILLEFNHEGWKVQKLKSLVTYLLGLLFLTLPLAMLAISVPPLAAKLTVFVCWSLACCFLVYAWRLNHNEVIITAVTK